MRRNKLPAVAVHLIRVAVVVALLWLLPSPRKPSSLDGIGHLPPDLALVQSVLPDAAAIVASPGRDDLWDVRAASGATIARAARTLPAAEGVVGYRGPTEALILIDDQFQLIGVRLIDSVDTQEHVAAVKEDTAFFKQFRDWSWSGPEPGISIDAVSGATLTSLALADPVERGFRHHRERFDEFDGPTVGNRCTRDRDEHAVFAERDGESAVGGGRIGSRWRRSDVVEN